VAWLGSCSAVARGGHLSFADATCAMLLYRTVACNKSCCSGRDPFVCLSGLGIFHTSGEAAFPRPRLGPVLTPLGVNIIALACNCNHRLRGVKLLHLSEIVGLFCCVAHGFGLQQGEQVIAILVCVMHF